MKTGKFWRDCIRFIQRKGSESADPQQKNAADKAVAAIEKRLDDGMVQAPCLTNAAITALVVAAISPGHAALIVAFGFLGEQKRRALIAQRTAVTNHVGS